MQKYFFRMSLFFAIFTVCCTAPEINAQQIQGNTQTISITQTDAPQNAEITQVPQAAEQKKEKNIYACTFWALIPPVLAIMLALITKEVYSSLFIGIVLGGGLAAEFSPLKMFDIIIDNGFIEAVKTTSGIFIFLIILGVIVCLISKSGAANAFGQWSQAHVKSRTGAIFSTFFLGVLIFIDDYFNCLTVGNVMRPVTDTKGISRAKLAYIIDATAAPVCMIAPISSWAAAVSQYASGTQYSGLELFIRAIPYNFYSLLSLIFIAAITLLKIDFGPMAYHEQKAMRKIRRPKTLQKENQTMQYNPKGRIADMLIPIFMLIAICVFALVYNGGIMDGKDFISAFSDTDATVALPWGAMLVLILTFIYMLLRRVISFKSAMECLPQGFNAMVPPILILTFATALKNMTSLLEAKEFIAGIIKSNAGSLEQFLPAVIFIIAALLAFSTGTSWGTFGILIPIVSGIFPVENELLIIGISACLAGAVCGDHCSPISDTTIMSSAGAQCDHIVHVSTQLPYSITVAILSFFSFILAGLIRNWFIVFILSIMMLVGLLLFFKYFSTAKYNHREKKTC